MKGQRAGEAGRGIRWRRAKKRVLENSAKYGGKLMIVGQKGAKNDFLNVC